MKEAAGPALMTGAVTVAAPSFGPAVVTVFGADIPILAFCLSILALLLARWIAPPPLRKLTREQQIALTILLVIFQTLVVTGNMPVVGDGQPLGAGMAVVWGIGLGFSGLFVVELLGSRVRAMLRAAFGMAPEETPDEQ